MAQKANMEAIFHAVADAVVTLDLDLRVVQLNRAAQRLFARREAEVAGLPAGELMRGRLWEVSPVPRSARCSQ
jgi:PAS domain S-box-containing protein